MLDLAKPVANDALPEVQLEVRSGGRVTPYGVSQVDFLIGTVPGCDLRVPGADLPAVLCLLARHPSGLKLRKLAPTQLLLVNGNTCSSADLADGDRITLGALDLFVRMKGVAAHPAQPQKNDPLRDELEKKMRDFRAQLLAFQEEREAFKKSRQTQLAEHAEQTADLEQREQALKAEVAKLAGSSSRAHDSANDLEVRSGELDRQKQELAGQRQELADIRRQLYERYQERRDRLAGLQEAVDRAARKVQERKRLLESEEQNLHLRKQADTQREADFSRQAAELARETRKLESERRALSISQSSLQSGVDAKLADLEQRESALAGERRDLEVRLKQYQADLLRLDRLQGSVEQREKDLLTKEASFSERLTQLQRDGADLEAEVMRLDHMRTEITEECDRLSRQKAEQDATKAQLAQRGAAQEGQQATLAALRTRLERMRDEARQQEQLLADERARQEQSVQNLAEERQALEQMRRELEAERNGGEQERTQLLERSATLDAAVAQLTSAQARHAQDVTALQERSLELERRERSHTENEGVLQSRLQQLAEAQERLDSERAALRERTQAVTQAEQAREALQEQLRRRSEDLTQRQRALSEKTLETETLAAGLEARRLEMDRQQREAQGQLDQMRADLEKEAELVGQRHADLSEKVGHQTRQFEQLQNHGKEIAGQRKALAQDRAAAALEQNVWLETQAAAKAEFDLLRKEAVDLNRQLPDLELHAGTTLERLTHAREQLRDHLAELHAYAHACQEDLDQLRARIQKDETALQDREQALRRNHEEHRLAMVAFRQQLIGWQGQIADMKRLLASDETRLVRKQALVAEQVKELDQTTEKLARQAEDLQHKQEEVAGRRLDMDRHLGDMREWYRRKLRELAGIDLAEEALEADLADDAPFVSLPVKPQADSQASKLAPLPSDEEALIPTGRDILSLTEQVDDGDRQFGETLADLQLVDRETLSALLVEARRQRRSLRQILLAGGVVTVYQMALIETGQVERLMIGPVRVIDRVRVSRSETIYRVFDPRRSQEAVLRHLSEDEMKDPLHPDEFRQRFTQTMIEHPNLARTLEVLEIAGRPAVLQEWLHGLPSSDWPPLAAAPGVCFRLLTQAALGLATIHKAGLIHGRLADSSLFLAGDGLLKITGLGEPPWITGQDESRDIRSDLRALGQIVGGWCTPSGVRKGPKTKPLPDSLVSILYRLNADGQAGLQDAEQLLEELDRAGADIPANAEAWDRLLRYVREHGTPEALLKQSA